MNEKPTPETDAFAVKFKTTCGEKYWIPVDIARKLERERDKAQEDATNYYAKIGELEHELKNMQDQRDLAMRVISRLERERDEAREQYHQICSQTLIEINKAHEERDEARARVELIKPHENNPVAEFFSSSNTPETDAEHAQFAMGGFTLDFCRKLERERDEAREVLKEIAEASGFDNIGNWARNKARKEIDRYREKNDLLPISWDV